MYCNEFLNEKLPYPEFFDFSTITNETVMLYSSANFYRNQYNSNLEITILQGVNLSPTIYFSSDVYLSTGTFNLTKPIDEISYPENKDALILKDMTFLHDILIQFKMTKYDGSNYTNQREIRCTLVKDNGDIYDSGIYSNVQSSSGQHDNILLRGSILHNLSDRVRIKFNIIQDNEEEGPSDTRLTIFRISWNILGLKTT